MWHLLQTKEFLAKPILSNNPPKKKSKKNIEKIYSLDNPLQQCTSMWAHKNKAEKLQQRPRQNSRLLYSSPWKARSPAHRLKRRCCGTDARILCAAPRWANYWNKTGTESKHINGYRILKVGIPLRPIRWYDIVGSWDSDRLEIELLYTVYP